MTIISAERKLLNYQYVSEKIDLATAADWLYIDWTKRPGYPTRQRYNEWHRQSKELADKENSTK